MVLLFSAGFAWGAVEPNSLRLVKAPAEVGLVWAGRSPPYRVYRSETPDAIALPAPLESLAITLSGITGDSGRQESLFSDVRRRAQLDDAVRQLRARLGRRPPIYRIREVEPWSRIPERRRALVAYEP